MRAAWFIKLSSAYTVAISEAKIKKRQMPDPTQGKTKNLCLWLSDCSIPEYSTLKFASVQSLL